MYYFGLCRSARESYGDNSVGYIELQRTGVLCLVKGQMCPEHRDRNKNYYVSITVDEAKGEVVDMHCQDCAASLGEIILNISPIHIL